MKNPKKPPLATVTSLSYRRDGLHVKLLGRTDSRRAVKQKVTRSKAKP